MYMVAAVTPAIVMLLWSRMLQWFENQKSLKDHFLGPSEGVGGLLSTWLATRGATMALNGLAAVFSITVGLMGTYNLIKFLSAHFGHNPRARKVLSLIHNFDQVELEDLSKTDLNPQQICDMTSWRRCRKYCKYSYLKRRCLPTEEGWLKYENLKRAQKLKELKRSVKKSVRKSKRKTAKSTRKSQSARPASRSRRTKGKNK
jgi:hypothetical protein